MQYISISISIIYHIPFDVLTRSIFIYFFQFVLYFLQFFSALKGSKWAHVSSAIVFEIWKKATITTTTKCVLSRSPSVYRTNWKSAYFNAFTIFAFVYLYHLTNMKATEKKEKKKYQKKSDFLKSENWKITINNNSDVSY